MASSSSSLGPRRFFPPRIPDPPPGFRIRSTTLSVADTATLLLPAAYDGDVPQFKMLVKRLRKAGKGVEEALAEIKCPSYKGHGPVHLAALSAKMVMCKYLIKDLKLDVNAGGDDEGLGYLEQWRPKTETHFKICVVHSERSGTKNLFFTNSQPKHPLRQLCRRPNRAKNGDVDMAELESTSSSAMSLQPAVGESRRASRGAPGCPNPLEACLLEQQLAAAAEALRRRERRDRGEPNRRRTSQIEDDANSKHKLMIESQIETKDQINEALCRRRGRSSDSCGPERGGSGELAPHVAAAAPPCLPAAWVLAPRVAVAGAIRFHGWSVRREGGDLEAQRWRGAPAWTGHQDPPCCLTMEDREAFPRSSSTPAQGGGGAA